MQTPSLSNKQFAVTEYLRSVLPNGGTKSTVLGNMTNVTEDQRFHLIVVNLNVSNHIQQFSINKWSIISGQKKK